MDFDALNDFRLVATYGGFGKAARASGRPKATLSKRIIDLENRLGVKLIDREGGRLHLTEEGSKLALRADHLLAEIKQVEDELRSGLVVPRGRLCVAAPHLFSQVWMGGIAAKFVAKYPEVELETIIVDDAVHSPEAWFDVLIQANPPPSGDFVGRVFARDSVRLIGSARLLRDLPPDASEICVPAFTIRGAPKPEVWDTVVGARPLRLRPKFTLQLPTRTMVRDAVREGCGVAELPRSIVIEDLSAGAMVDLGPASRSGVELWALHASRRLVSRKITTFVELLCESFKGYL